MTQDQVAEAITVSSSLIGGFETGRILPMPDTAKALDGLFGTGEEIQRLSAAAREDAQPPWMRPWTENERRAIVLRSFQPLVIPGLLQTEAYTRAILGAWSHSPAQLEEIAAGRLARQEATLGRPDPVTLSVIVSEAVLREGDPLILKDQLEHLVDIGHRPNVLIRVIPRGAAPHAGLAGAFVLASLPSGERVGYLDDQLSGRVVADPREVGRLERSWETVNAVALPVEQSRNTILKVIDEYE